VQSFISSCRRHPWINAGCAAGYFILVVLPHLQVGLFFQWLFSHFTRSQYQLGVLSGFVLLFLVLCLVLLRGMIVSRRVAPVLVYLGITFVLTAVSFKLLVIHNIELIHLPQYTLLAVLIFPLARRFGDTVFWTTLLGAVDEAYQYFILAPERTMQYDFNDIILNLLGAAFGVILLFACGVSPEPCKKRALYANPVLLTLLGLAAGIVIMFQTGLLTLYPPQDGQPVLGVIVKELPKGFWSHISHLNAHYHIVLPLEGLILTGLLLALYYSLDTTSFYLQRKNHAK